MRVRILLATNNASISPPVFVQRAIWAGLVLVIAVVLVIALVRPSARKSLPVLGVVPEFSLVERSGKAITAADLKGKPWIADFVFTRCGNVCPILSARFARLQGAVQLVSFSVDPDHDTPAVLQEYAGRFHADSGGWLFLTGDRVAMDQLITKGFDLSVAQRPEIVGANPNDLVTHSDRFVLVDADLKIRGYYRGTDDDAIEQILRDVAALSG